jgi:hypothetical protein
MFTKNKCELYIYLHYTAASINFTSSSSTIAQCDDKYDDSKEIEKAKVSFRLLFRTEKGFLLQNGVKWQLLHI